MLPVVLRKEKLVEPVRRLPGEVVCQLSVLRQIDALLMDQGVTSRTSWASWRKEGPVQPHCSNSSGIRKQGEKSPPSPWKSRPRVSLAAELAQIRYGVE